MILFVLLPAASQAMALLYISSTWLGWPVRQLRFQRRPRRSGAVFYVGTLAVLWTLGDLGLIPLLVMAGGSIALLVAVQFLPPDDDDRRGRKRRAAAWKRVKQWLAVGTPAVRPEVG